MLLLTNGYTYRQTADILFVDEESISRWVLLYLEKGLHALKNHSLRRGEQGQGRLSATQPDELGKLLEQFPP